MGDFDFFSIFCCSLYLVAHAITIIELYKFSTLRNENSVVIIWMSRIPVHMRARRGKNACISFYCVWWNRKHAMWNPWSQSAVPCLLPLKQQESDVFPFNLRRHLSGLYCCYQRINYIQYHEWCVCCWIWARPHEQEQQKIVVRSYETGFSP